MDFSLRWLRYLELLVLDVIPSCPINQITEPPPTGLRQQIKFIWTLCFSLRAVIKAFDPTFWRRDLDHNRFLLTDPKQKLNTCKVEQVPHLPALPTALEEGPPVLSTDMLWAPSFLPGSRQLFLPVLPWLTSFSTILPQLLNYNDVSQLLFPWLCWYSRWLSPEKAQRTWKGMFLARNRNKEEMPFHGLFMSIYFSYNL